MLDTKGKLHERIKDPLSKDYPDFCRKGRPHGKLRNIRGHAIEYRKKS